MVVDVLTVNITQNDTTICEGDSLVLVSIDNISVSENYNGTAWHVCKSGSNINGDGSYDNPFE